MSDLKLDADHDIVIENGDLVFVGKTEDNADKIEEIKQRVKIRVLTAKGEWLYDTEKGIDYKGRIFAADVEDDMREAHIRAEISDVEGVTLVSRVELVMDPAEDRDLVVNVDFETPYGSATVSA